MGPRWGLSSRFINGHLLIVFSHRERSEGTLWGLFVQGLNLFMRIPMISQKPHLQMQSHWRSGFNIWMGVGHTILTVAFTDCFQVDQRYDWVLILRNECWLFYEEWAEGLRVGIRELFASWKIDYTKRKKIIEGSTGWLFL